MLCWRRISAIGTPASPCFRISTIWLSVNRDFRMGISLAPESLRPKCLPEGEAYGGTSEYREGVYRIPHQPSGLHERPSRGHCRQPVAQSERADLGRLQVHHLVAADQHRSRMALQRIAKRGRDIVGPGNTQGLNLEVKRPSGRIHFLQPPSREWVVWVEQHRYPFDVWDGFHQKR